MVVVKEGAAMNPTGTLPPLSPRLPQQLLRLARPRATWWLVVVVCGDGGAFWRERTRPRPALLRGQARQGGGCRPGGALALGGQPAAAQQAAGGLGEELRAGGGAIFSPGTSGGIR